MRRVGARQQDGEFVAAIAREQILRPESGRDPAGGLSQDGVADEVSVDVVQRLELVDVDHQQRHRRRIPCGARELPLERRIEPEPVAQPRQAVDGGERLELILEAVRFCQHGVVVPHPAGENAQQIARDGRRGVHQIPELRTRDHEADRRLGRDHVRRDARMVDDRQLADALARPEADVRALRGREVHGHRAGDDEIQRLVLLARAKQDLIGLEQAATAGVQEAIDDGTRDFVKESGPLDVLE